LKQRQNVTNKEKAIEGKAKEKHEEGAVENNFLHCNLSFHA
jgi:mannitol/fructose-specific phosphotransferase system IIA component